MTFYSVVYAPMQGVFATQSLSESLTGRKEGKKEGREGKTQQQQKSARLNKTHFLHDAKEGKQLIN